MGDFFVTTIFKKHTTVLYLTVMLASAINACTHKDFSGGLSWTIPNTLVIENRELKPLIVENTPIQPGKKGTFFATSQGSLHIAYGKNIYKLTYPTCTATAGSCSGKNTALTITSTQIKIAIHELHAEQKEICFLPETTRIGLVENTPIDELCITNDTPFPVKICAAMVHKKMRTDLRASHYQNVEPGHTYQIVIPTEHTDQEVSGKPESDFQKTIIIDDTLGNNRSYLLTIPQYIESRKRVRTLDTSNVTQATLVMSALQKIKSGLYIQLIDSK